MRGAADPKPNTLQTAASLTPACFSPCAVNVGWEESCIYSAGMIMLQTRNLRVVLTNVLFICEIWKCILSMGVSTYRLMTAGKKPVNFCLSVTTCFDGN